MPLLLSCQELRPGMCLTEPLVWRGLKMLSAGAELTPRDIHSLRARFPEHAFRVHDPLLEGAVEFEDDSHEREVARHVQSIIAGCMAEVQDRIMNHASLDALSVLGIQRAIDEVINYLKDNPVPTAILDQFIGGDHHLSARSANVFYLSMMLASATRGYISMERKRQTSAKNLTYKISDNLAPLGLGAMMMDLGMLPLAYLYAQLEPLTPEIWAKIRDHPMEGAKLLPEDFPSAAKAIILTHHENVDGTGYPEGLKGDDLHVFSRIVRITDAFEAATSRHLYKEAKSAARVIWEMSDGPYNQFYDQNLMRAFRRLIQPFPIGAKIRLRDRQYGVVVRSNRADPLAPQIVVAFDSLSRRIPNGMIGKVHTLGESEELKAASYAGEDLSYIYDGEDVPLKASTVGVWPSLFQAAYP